MPTQKELRQQLTNQILAALDEGVVPWRRPWSLDPNCGRPTNAVTKKPYNGINILLLTVHNDQFRLAGKYFATYKQWQSVGGQVMGRPADVPRGQWGCKAILFKSVTKVRTDSNGEEVDESFSFMRQFCLFNVDQVRGDHLDHLRPGYEGNTTETATSI